MKSLSKFFALLILLSAVHFGAKAQEDYVMFLAINLDPIPGKSVQLVKGVQEHNAAYHTEGASKAYLWAILTGPRSGQYAWAQGPMKYGNMDEDLTAEHQADWASKVMSNCRNNEDIRMFKRSEAHTYNPENEVIGEKVIARIFYGVSDRAALLDGMMKIKEVLSAKNRDYARRVYVNDFRNIDNEDVMLIYPFDSWSIMETRQGLEPEFGPIFDEVHGEGSWAKMTDVLGKSAEGWYDEIRVIVK